MNGARAMLQELLTLTRLLQRATERADWTAWERLAAGRERLLSRLTRAAIPLTAAEREVVLQIQHLDERVRACLSDRRGAVAAELRAIGRGRTALQGYGQAVRGRAVRRGFGLRC